MFWEIQKMVAKPETIFWLAGKMVPAVRKIFSVAPTKSYQEKWEATGRRNFCQIRAKRW